MSQESGSFHPTVLLGGNDRKESDLSEDVSATEKRVQSDKGLRDEKYGRPMPSRLTVPVGQIAARLGLAFGLVIALLIGVGDLGIRRIDRINADLQDIMDREWVKLRLTREAVTYSNRNSYITMQVFLLTDHAEIKSLLAARAENSNRVV